MPSLEIKFRPKNVGSELFLVITRCIMTFFNYFNRLKVAETILMTDNGGH